MHRHASPALLLLEQVLQMQGDDWEERAKTRLADAFRGLGPAKDEVQEAVFDIFAKAMELSRTVEEVKQSEKFVSRLEQAASCTFLDRNSVQHERLTLSCEAPRLTSVDKQL